MTSESKLQGTPKRGFFANSIPLSARQNRVLNIFFYTVFAGTAAAMLGIILYYVYCFAALYNGSDGGNWLLGIFSDFVSIMHAALADNPYALEDPASYPPAAILVLYPFAWICRGVFDTYSHISNENIDELTSNVILHAEFWVALVLFFLICIVSILVVIVKKYRLDAKAALKVGITAMLSAPFVYAIMRGNTIYFALVFLLLFLLLYDSPNALCRELAYICLAIAGAIKIYPLFFGVFLLKDGNLKNIFASLRVAVYFAVIFVGSFYFFPAGTELFEPFVGNLGGFMEETDRLLSLRNLSIPSILYKILYLISPTLAASSLQTVLSYILIGVIFVSATVTAIAAKSDLSRAIIASAVLILIPSISYFYILIFEIIPFLEYLRAYDSLPTWKCKLYGAMFMFMFIAILLLPQCFIPHALIILVMLIMEQKNVVQNDMLPRIGAKVSSKKA